MPWPDEDDGPGLGTTGDETGGETPSGSEEEEFTGTGTTGSGYLPGPGLLGGPSSGGGGGDDGGSGGGSTDGGTSTPTMRTVEGEVLAADVVSTSEAIAESIAKQLYPDGYTLDIEPTTPVDYGDQWAELSSNSEGLIDAIKNGGTALEAVTDECAVVEEVPPEPVDGGTHYTNIETESIDAYSSYRSGTSGNVIGTIAKNERVYLYPEEEFVGLTGDWCKVNPIEGELIGTDCYIQRAHLVPLSGTNQSLNIVDMAPLEPKGYVPDWRQRGPCNPFYNPRTGKYCATVATEYKYADDAIYEEALEPGITQLMEYYSRSPTGSDDLLEAAQFLLANSYHFAQVEQVYLSPNPDSTAKALVTVSSRYFNAIPKFSSAPVLPKNGIRSVLLNTYTVEADFDLVSNTLKQVNTKLNSFNGEIIGFKPNREAIRLGKTLSALKELIRVNGFEFRSDHEDLIEVAVDGDFKPLQVVLYIDGLGHKLDIGFNAFKVSTGPNLPRTMHYVLQVHNMLSYIRTQKFKTTAFDWLTFSTMHTFPALEVRFTSVLTPGLNTKQLQAKAHDMKTKFDSVPFKDVAQLNFEMEQLNDPKFLMEMSLARANVNLPSGDNILLQLPDLLDEISGLGDLFNKFLGKVEIPKLIQMAMSGIMSNMSFPDLFEAMLSAILKQLTIEMIVEQVVSKLDLEVQTNIFGELVEAVDLPADCYCAIFDKIDLSMSALESLLPEGTLSIETSTTTATAGEPGESPITYDTAESCEKTATEAIAAATTTNSNTCTAVVDVDPNILAAALVEMVIKGVAEITMEGTELTKQGQEEGASIAGSTSKYPAITPTKIKKAMFEIIEECSGFSPDEIIELISGSLKGQMSAGTLEIDTLKNLPIISTSFDTMMSDSSMDLNMEIPQLSGLAVEMPSVNMSMGSIDIPSMKIPTITLPEVPTFDLMGMVFEGIEEAVKAAIVEALIAMAKQVIEALLGDFESGIGDLSFGEANIGDLLANSLGSIGSATATISQTFSPIGIDADGTTGFSEEQISSSLSSCGGSGVAGEVGTPEDFLDDISEALNITEVENLLNGNPSPNACEVIHKLIQSGYSNMAPAFEDCSKISEVFAEIGESIDPELIQSLKPKKARVVNKLEYLCKEVQPFDEEPYRDVMRAKGLADEEIEEQLQQEKDIQKQALEDLANLLADVQSDSVLSELIPPIYPEDCGMPSLLPPDSEIPEMTMVNEMVVDSVLAGTKTAWKAETDLYFESLLSGSQVGEVIPLIYDGPEANKPVVNPRFMSMYSSGFPLCDNAGVAYQSADDIAMCKTIIDSKNPARNPELPVFLAVMKTKVASDEDDLNDLEGVFEDPDTILNNWFGWDEETADGEGQDYPTSDDFKNNIAAFFKSNWLKNNSAEERFETIWSKVNVLQSEISHSVTGDMRNSYNRTSELVEISPTSDPSDYDSAWTEDFVFTLTTDDSSVSTTMTIPLSASGSKTDTKSGATVDVATEASCVAPISECLACEPAPTEPTDDFEAGAPKPAQVLSQMIYHSYRTFDGAATDEKPAEAFGSGTTPSHSYSASLIMVKMFEEYADKFNELSQGVYDNLSKEFLLDMKIEASLKEGCEPTFVLDPAGAKSAAMDAINSKCPKPPTPGERSPTADGALVGLIELTLRAYIADIMLRSGPLLTALPVTTPSEILKSYIYNDMVFDMKKISSQYYSDFFSEAIKMYNDRDDATQGMTDYQIFSVLIGEQFAKVVPALAKNLGAKYKNLHIWNCEWLEENRGDLSGAGVVWLNPLSHDEEGRFVSLRHYDKDSDITTILAEYEPEDPSASTEAMYNGLIATEEYQTIFNYCVPINDIASLYHLTIAKQTTINSPIVQASFDGTKEELKMAFDVLYYGPESKLAHAVGPSNEQAFNDANNNMGTQVETFSDNTSMAKIMIKMVINTIPTMIKGLAEQLDPNIAITKLIRNKALESGVSMHPIEASMSVLPMNIIPPVFGGFGPPIGPLGFMYWALAKPDKIEKRILEQAATDASTPDDTGATLATDDTECNPSEDVD